MNKTNLSGEVVFQLSLTKDEVEKWIPEPLSTPDLRYDVKKTPAVGLDLIHLELRVMAFGLSGLKSVMQEHLGLDVDYMIESKCAGFHTNHYFRLQLRLGDKAFLSQLYEPNNHVDRILSGEFSTLKFYLADLVRMGVANPMPFIVATCNFVGPEDRSKIYQSEFNYQNLKNSGETEALTYINVYKMLKQRHPIDAEKMNFHLYSSLMCLRELTASVKNHG